MQAGKLEKVVVARYEVASRGLYATFVRWPSKRLPRFPNTMVSTTNGRGGFIGATPETLIRIENGRVETHALAGRSQQIHSACWVMPNFCESTHRPEIS